MSAYSFTDSKGVTREIRVTFKSIFDVAEKVGVDLFNPQKQTERGGGALSEDLMDSPGLLMEVVAALCGEDRDAFAEAIDGKAFAEMENAFWEAYVDFFDQSGRKWLTVALKRDLQTKKEADERTAQKLLSLPQETFSESSPLPTSPTGSIEPSGNYQDAPTPILDSNVQDKRKSSARSTTPTSPKEKTSGARPTSILTKKPARKKKQKRS